MDETGVPPHLRAVLGLHASPHGWQAGQGRAAGHLLARACILSQLSYLKYSYTAWSSPPSKRALAPSGWQQTGPLPPPKSSRSNKPKYVSSGEIQLSMLLSKLLLVKRWYCFLHVLLGLELLLLKLVLMELS